VTHGGRNDLVDGDPGPHHDPSPVPGPKYEHEAGVQDDLAHVVGAGDVVEQGTLWHGVCIRTPYLQLRKDLVSLQLVVPGTQEDEDQDHCEEVDGGSGVDGVV